MVTTSRQSASGTIVPPIRKSLRNSGSANTGLASTTLINLHHCPTSTFSLVGKFSDERRPTRILNRFCHHSANQASHVKVFHGDESIFVDQTTRQFVMEIRPLVAHPDMSTPEQLDCFAPSPTALLAPPQFSLGPAQLRLGFLVVSWIVHRRSVRENGETVQTQIDPCGLLGSGEWSRVLLDTEMNIPTASLALDSDRLALTLQRPVKYNLDVPSALNMEFTVGQQATTIAIRRKSQAVIPPGGSETGESPSLSRFASSVESLESDVKPANDILGALRIHQSQTTVLPHSWQLTLLVHVLYRFALDFPSSDSFFHRRVVQRAGLKKLAGEKSHLRFGWLQSVLEREAHLVNFHNRPRITQSPERTSTERNPCPQVHTR